MVSCATTIYAAEMAQDTILRHSISVLDFVTFVFQREQVKAGADERNRQYQYDQNDFGRHVTAGRNNIRNCDDGERHVRAR